MLIRDFSYYDQIIVNYSGGKDSTACALLMKEFGIPVEKVWLWHQCIDGRGDTEIKFFDWPSTEGYVTKFSDHIGMKLDFQWRDYGFYGELTRQESLTNDVSRKWLDDNRPLIAYDEERVTGRNDFWNEDLEIEKL